MPYRLLPALIPSWRFFDSIGPSPRVDYALVLHPADLRSVVWREFRPRPAHLSFAQMLKRLVWNPVWNETLFVVRCAERWMEGEAPFPEVEIRRRLTRAAFRGELLADGPVEERLLAFRIRVLVREAGDLGEEILFVSPPRPLDPGLRA